MAKYTYEQRLKAVLDVVEKHMSCRAVGKQLGCGRSPVRRWVKRYELHGLDGLALKRITYSGELKQHIVEYMHKNYLSFTQTAELFGVANETTVSNWERIYYEEGPQALHADNSGQKKNMQSDKLKKETIIGKKTKKEEHGDLLAEIERLRMENAYLKKLNALVQERIARENGKK